MHSLIRDVFLLMKDRGKKMDMSLRFRVFIHYIYVVINLLYAPTMVREVAYSHCGDVKYTYKKCVGVK